MISLLQPPFLKKGDRVAIVATASSVQFEKIQEAICILEQWGLEVHIGKSIGAKDGLFAGSDLLRTKDLQEALDNPEIKAILFARGGYGTVRIIDNIDFTRFLRNPKWLCGYSDITVIHTHVNHVLAVQTLHSTMPIKFTDCSTEALESLRKSLFGEPLVYEFISHPMNKPGKTVTQISGGNLSILYSLTGTNTTFSFNHKTLFIEDLDEYYYHVDRMMMNLKRAGKLKNIDALLVGGFSDMKDTDVSFEKDSYAIISEYVKDVDIPVAFDIPCGHIFDNRTIPFGKSCLISINNDHTIIDFSKPV